jgi:hypothetical protein
LPGYYDKIGFGIDFTLVIYNRSVKKMVIPEEIAKARDHSAAISKEFLDVSSLPDRQSIKFEMILNGKTVQHSDAVS